MRRINQFKQIKHIIINHPLFPIVEELAFQNNFPKTFNSELRKILSNDTDTFEALTSFTQSIHTKKMLEEHIFHYLLLMVQSTEETFITKENFNKFINDKLIDPTKSTEENNQMLQHCKNVLTNLGIQATYIKPIQEEYAEYKKLKEENNYDNVLWTKTEAAKFIDIKRQTIYNWIKAEDFTNEAGKVVVSEFRQFLKKYKPREYAIFQKKWDEQVD